MTPRGLIQALILAVCMPLLIAPAAPAAGLGLQSFEMSATEAPPAGHAPDALGPADVQAGSHPYELITSFTLQEPELVGRNRYRPVGGGLKDVHAELPPGFVGDPNAVPKCPFRLLQITGGCPDDSVVGEIVTEIGASEAGKALHGEQVDAHEYATVPVYNMQAPSGVAAELGFRFIQLAPVLLDASVRAGGDYGITVSADNVSQAVSAWGSKLIIWGVPGDPRHDALRGKCLGDLEQVQRAVEEEGGPYDYERTTRELEERVHRAQHYKEGATAPAACPFEGPVRPFLTNPTSCGEERSATLSVDGWDEPGVLSSKTVTLPELVGCENLAFGPSLTVLPDGSAGSTPTGLNVGVHVPQESTVNPEGQGEADVRDTTVTLPAGVQLSPAAADGLQACSTAEVGFKGVNAKSGAEEFAEKVYNPETKAYEATLCPLASKIANVSIATPLLEHELTGSVYLAAPQNFAGLPQNPFSSLIAMYLVAAEPERGVLIKLPGKVELGTGENGLAPGQVRTSFENTPQLPFENLKLEFYGTARAPLATPALCGTYTTQTSFVPWSGQAAKSPSANFQITSGPNGSPCSAPPPFSPSLTSGVTNINAGGFSPLTTTLSREDGQQNIQSVELHYPPGLSGILTGVKLCGEAEANAGTCPEASEIGETIVSVGLGNDPFSVTGGKVYLTGPYEGAPFGLSIVNPAKAGPFDLQEGRPVVVRATINVDPHTAALTVTTNTAAQGYAIPSMIEGIPLQIKHVNVLVNRPGFTFNPTSCNPANIEGTINSAEGASSPVKIPFQVTNCEHLKFTPRFSVSTSGKTSKANGASLTAKVTEPAGSLGTQANIAYVKVELPVQLPSRLTTLQKACTSAQFEANPAGCPSPSVIGRAKVITPLVPVPLEGPVYFVSHGGEAFPSLEVVLQGYGVKIVLVGTTFISKSGITSTTFKTVPDQPFSTFEINLPEGPYSALTANGNLCALARTVTIKKKVSVRVKGHKRTVTRKVKEALGESLVMPNEFVAQNGAVIHQSTNISVTGCAKLKPAKTTKHKRRAGGKKGRGASSSSS